MVLNRRENCSQEAANPASEEAGRHSPAFWEIQASPTETAGLERPARERRAAHPTDSLLLGACTHPFPQGLAQGSLTSFMCA